MHVEKTKVVAGSIRKLLRRGAQSHVANLIFKLHPGDVSHIMFELNERDQVSLFAVLLKGKLGLAAEVLSNLGFERSKHLLAAISPSEIAKVLQELETDDRADFIAALPEDIAEEVLEHMRREDFGRCDKGEAIKRGTLALRQRNPLGERAIDWLCGDRGIVLGPRTVGQ